MGILQGEINPAFTGDNLDSNKLESDEQKPLQPDLPNTLVSQKDSSVSIQEFSVNGTDKNVFSDISIFNDYKLESNSEKHGHVNEDGEASVLDEEENDYDEFKDMKCGLGCFSPDWIQKYATKRVFVIIFSLLGVIQGMTWSYFTATITTLEKRFKISSQTAGIVMTGNEISQILFSVFISYFGGKGHRPRWISVGVALSAISCFVLASPQAIFGSGNDSLALTEEFGYLYEVGGLSSSMGTPSYDLTNKIGNGKKGRVSVCRPTAGSKQAGACDDAKFYDASATLTPLVIVFLSQFVSGIGNILFFSLGGPYLDDNTSRSNMPAVLGTTMSFRLIGPTLGFLLASGTLKIFINPLLTPIIAPDDPRWLGAWWLGWVILGCIMLIMSVIIAFFPKRLRRKHTKSVDTDKINTPEAIPKIGDIPAAVKSLLRNRINLFNNLAGVFYLFSALGYWTYMPKYLETVFMQTASNASIISGVVGILFQSSGMLISGLLITKFQPSARKLAAWNVAIAIISVCTMVGFTQLGCNVGKLFGHSQSTDGSWNLTSPCNADCNCKISKILPVCYKETNTVFYSACHAGCTSSFENGTISNCKCISEENANATLNASVQLGNCAEGCGIIFIMFLGISAMIKFFDATGRIGNMLISYRCVELKDRSLSIGLNILLISLFAFLPSPILFGRIIDNVCLVWGGSSCGKRGNCMLYDGEQLRYIFNLTAAAFTFIGGVLDCFVLYFVKDLELYDEPDVSKLEKQNKESTNKIENLKLGIANISYSQTESNSVKL